MAIVDRRTVGAAFTLLALLVVSTPGPRPLRRQTPGSSSITGLRNRVRMTVSDFPNEFLSPDLCCRWIFWCPPRVPSPRR